MPAPKISIVIPLFNRENLVSETLESIHSQTFEQWECTVVDDGSTDRSIEVVRQYAAGDSRIRVLRRPEERIKGPATCRNIGLERSRGEYLYFFDSDDLLQPKFFETILGEIENVPDLDYAGFQTIRFRDRPENVVWRSRKFDPKKGSLFEQIILNKIPANTPNFLWKRAFLEQHGISWQEGFFYGEDTAFVCQAVCHAKEGTWLDIPDMVFARNHSESLSGRSTKIIYESMEARTRILKHIYEYCVENNKMSSGLHRRYLRHLLRLQLVFTVLYGDYHATGMFLNLLKTVSAGTVHDGAVLLLARMFYVLTLPIYWIGKCLRH